MLWLRSQDEHALLARLDEVSGRYELWYVGQLGQEEPGEISGMFALLDRTFCAVYRADARLLLRVGTQVVDLNDDTQARVTGRLGRRHLVVDVGGARVIDIRYAVDAKSIIKGDMTAGVELEDFDFGLWVAHLSESPLRRRVMLGLE